MLHGNNLNAISFFQEKKYDIFVISTAHHRDKSSLKYATLSNYTEKTIKYI